MLTNRSIAYAVLVTIALVAQTKANEITFPVGTPVTTVFTPNFAQYVDRDGFRFNKFLGSLSINSINYDGAHPGGGGLFVGAAGNETSLTMSRLDGQPFGIESLTILERNGPTGLALTLGARPHGGMPSDFIEQEFLFDLNTSTYDTFDIAAADPRFASVDYVTFISVESPFVDPSSTNYIIDRITYSAVNPLAGDFDADGDVDGHDFLKWQRGESPNPLSETDLVNWQASYGNPNPLVAASLAVPEPTAGILMLTAAIGMLLRRRKSCGAPAPLM